MSFGAMYWLKMPFLIHLTYRSTVRSIYLSLYLFLSYISIYISIQLASQPAICLSISLSPSLYLPYYHTILLSYYLRQKDEGVQRVRATCRMGNGVLAEASKNPCKKKNTRFQRHATRKSIQSKHIDVQFPYQFLGSFDKNLKLPFSLVKQSDQDRQIKKTDGQLEQDPSHPEDFFQRKSCSRQIHREGQLDRKIGRQIDRQIHRQTYRQI